MQHCSPSTFQVNLPGLQSSYFEIWVFHPTTLQNQLLQLSFEGIFTATTPPNNFLAAAFSLYVINLFEVKKKKLGRFENLMFAVKLLANSAIVCILTLHYVLNMPSNFTFHTSNITWSIIWQLIIVEAVNNALMSNIRLCNYAMLNSNELIKVAYLQKLANQSGLRICDRGMDKQFF